MKFAIIMPAYNEEKRIGRTLEAYGAYFNEVLKNNKNLDYKIVVAINNTTDNTEGVVKEKIKSNKKIAYINVPVKGKGMAVISGFRYALDKEFDLIGFVDSDMATPPEEFWKLVKNVGNSGGVIADRYRKGAVILPKPTLKRLMAKRLFNFVVRSFLIMPYRDTQCGAKVFRKEALEEVISDLSMSQWAFDVELLYKLNRKGHIIRSFPTVWSDEKYSTINFWRSGPWMALAVARLRILNSPFSKFVRIYDKMIGFIPK